MKTKIVTAAFAFLFLTLTTQAFDRHAQPFAMKEVTITGKFQKISVGQNIKLVLTKENNNNSLTISGDQDRVENINVKVENNEMAITTRKNLKGGSVTVYIPVSDLSYIDLKSGASVASESVLKASNLTVFVNVDSKIELKVLGNVTVKQAEDCDVVYQENEMAKVVYVKQ